MCINEARFPCLFLARRIYHSLTKTLAEMSCLMLIHRWYYSKIQYLLFMNAGQMYFKEKVTRQLYFLQLFHTGESRFFCYNLSSPPAILYDTFCAVPI